MNRKLVAAISFLVLLAVGILFWRQARPSAVELTELSRTEFGRIEKATRRAMWRKAIGKGSFWSMLASPTSLWRRATSRISQIELLPIDGQVEVKTKSRSGNYFYYLINRNQGTGSSDWYVLSEGPGRQAHFVSLNGFRTLNFVKVDGGLGLIGGRLSTGDDGEEIKELLRQAPPSVAGIQTNGSKASFLAPINLGYDKQPSDPAGGTVVTRPFFEGTK
jgi:hypothetical protein